MENEPSPQISMCLPPKRRLIASEDSGPDGG